MNKRWMRFSSAELRVVLIALTAVCADASLPEEEARIAADLCGELQGEQA